MQRRFRVGVCQGAAVVALGIVLTVVMTFPVATRMSSGGRVDNEDGMWSVWSVAWVARTLVVEPSSLYDANIFHPHRRTLTFGENNLGPGVLAIPVYWLTGNPYAAHNSVLLLSFVLSFVAMFYLVRYLTGDAAGAIVPAILFAFCPYVFARFAHIHLVFIGVLPLALLAFHRLVEQQTMGRAAALGLVLAGAGLTSGYYGIFAGLAVGLGALVHSATDRRWRRWPYWASMLSAAGIASVVLLPFFIPYRELERETGFMRLLEDADRFSADWRSYFASSAWTHRWMLPLLGSWREVMFPGFLACGLGVLGLRIGLRRGHANRTREATVFYAILAGLACWASFGPRAGLYAVLYEAVPVLSFIRASARLGVLVTLSLAVLSGVGMAWVLSHRTAATRRRWVLAVALAAVLELASMPVAWFDAPPGSQAYRMLKVLPRAAVAEFPFFWQRRGLARHSYYMLNSTQHWQPLLNGYNNYIPPDFAWMLPHLETFPARHPFDILVDRGVRYVVFHLQLYDERSRAAVLRQIETYKAHLRPLVREDDVWLFEIVDWPPPDHVSELDAES